MGMVDVSGQFSLGPNNTIPTMPTINTIITRDDVRTQRDEVFAVIRDAIVGPFLDAAPAGVTAEVSEFSTDFVVGWQVRINVDKAIKSLVARHEALNEIGAGQYTNVAHGVRREVVRGYGEDQQLAIVRLIPRRTYGNAEAEYDLNVTVNSLAVGTDDRNNTVATTEDAHFKTRTIRVATVKAAAKKQGLAILNGVNCAEGSVDSQEADAADTIAHRAATAKVKAEVEALGQVQSVEWSLRHNAKTGTLSFPYLTPADALRILEAVKNLPAAR